jgi:hypothetical protein
MSVQDYYAELQKGMIHAGVHEETEDIVDYKKYMTLLTIRNTILLIVYSSLLCWTKKNYRDSNR